MKLSIPAWRNDRYVSLAELLLLIGRFFVNSKWYVKVEEVAPEPGDNLIKALDPLNPINIFDLLHIITPNIQIIDGTVIASDFECSKPLLVLRAVDSTSWDIETEISDVEVIIRSAYPEAQKIID